MARKQRRPKAGLHKASGRWRFKWQGHDHYHPTEAAADAAIDALIADNPPPTAAPLALPEGEQGSPAWWQDLLASAAAAAATGGELEQDQARAVATCASAARGYIDVRALRGRIEALEQQESDRERQARQGARSKTGRRKTAKGKPTTLAQDIAAGYDPANGTWRQ